MKHIKLGMAWGLTAASGITTFIVVGDIMVWAAKKILKKLEETFDGVTEDSDPDDTDDEPEYESGVRE